MNIDKTIANTNVRGVNLNTSNNNYCSGAFATIFLSLITACSSSDNNDSDGVNSIASDADIDGKLSMLIDASNLSGDPTTGRALPVITSAKAQLGKKLFFTKGLGGDSDSGCVTCHHPTLGGGDELSLAIGVGAESADLLGKGRLHALVSEHYDGGPTVPRNSPSTFNVGMWDKVLFHDGRLESLGKTTGANGDDGMGIRTPDSDFDVADGNAGANLAAAQARFPITSKEEMRGFTFAAGESNDVVRTALSEKLTGFGGWSEEFTAVYGDPEIDFDRITDAIAEYERSQVFVSSAWSAYVQGDPSAIDLSAKRGALIFYSSSEEGGANCVACHSGDFFTNEEFHVTALPQIGRGKGNGDSGNDDFGRFRESKDEADMYKFRTPTLLNVEVTGPWGHAGSYTDLAAVVRHMFNAESAIDQFDYSTLDPTVQAVDLKRNTRRALEQLKANRAAGGTTLTDFDYTEEQVSDLVSFLHSLTDPCVKSRSCLAPWIPGAQDTNPDGLRLNAINSSGEFL